MKQQMKATVFVAYNQEPKKVIGGFLTLSEQVFVTEESASMVSEAIAAGKPVVTLYPKALKPDSNYKKILEKFEQNKRMRRMPIEQLGQEDHCRDDFLLIERDSITEMVQKLKQLSNR